MTQLPPHVFRAQKRGTRTCLVPLVKLELSGSNKRVVALAVLVNRLAVVSHAVAHERGSREELSSCALHLALALPILLVAVRGVKGSHDTD